VAQLVDWLEGLSPWPADGFGLDRMHRILLELGHPERAFRAIHVVGTNGKSTTTRMIEELLFSAGMRSGSTISPHVERWSERIRVDCAEVDPEVALGRIHHAATAVGATQFEAVIAAAFAEFAAAEVDAAVVEAGLGGRLDATNTLGRSAVVVLTNVGLDHTDVLGSTRAEIATEKLAVVRAGSHVVIGQPEWEDAAWASGAATVVVEPGGAVALACAAAESFLGTPIDPGPATTVALPGRFERREREIRDGAHNPDGVRYLVERLGNEDYVVVAGILEDKDVDGMLELLSRVGKTLVATTTSSPRALSASELGRRAEPRFDAVVIETDPLHAVRRAHELGEPVLVTGSLTLLADLARREESRR
jgi:dihydrofolate synthase/folylpolyglutamate synthase